MFYLSFVQNVLHVNFVQNVFKVLVVQTVFHVLCSIAAGVHLRWINGQPSKTQSESAFANRFSQCHEMLLFCYWYCFYHYCYRWYCWLLTVVQCAYQMNIWPTEFQTGLIHQEMKSFNPSWIGTQLLIFIIKRFVIFIIREI